MIKRKKEKKKREEIRVSGSRKLNDGKKEKRMKRKTKIQEERKDLFH